MWQLMRSRFCSWKGTVEENHIEWRKGCADLAQHIHKVYLIQLSLSASRPWFLEVRQHNLCPRSRLLGEWKVKCHKVSLQCSAPLNLSSERVQLVIPASFCFAVRDTMNENSFHTITHMMNSASWKNWQFQSSSCSSRHAGLPGSWPGLLA